MKYAAFALLLATLAPAAVFDTALAGETTKAISAAGSASLASASSQNAGAGLLIEYPEARKLGYGVIWAASVVAEEGDWIRAWVLGDLVVVLQRPTNMVTVLSFKNGNPLWNKKIGSKLERVIAASRTKEHVMVNTEEFMKIFEWDTGDPVTTQRLSQRVLTAPVVVNDVAVFAGINGLVFGHNIRVGASNWKYRMRSGVYLDPVDGGNGRVFVADKSGHFAMFMSTRNRPLWQGRAFENITAQPVSNRLGVFIASEDHNIYSLNRAAGNDRVDWPYRTDKPLKTDPTLIDNYLFVQIPGRGLVAIDAARKKDLWSNANLKAKPVAVIKQGMLFNDTTRLLVLDAATGRKRNEASVSKVQNVIQGPKGSLILLSPTGRILRMDPLN